MPGKRCPRSLGASAVTWVCDEADTNKMRRKSRNSTFHSAAVLASLSLSIGREAENWEDVGSPNH